LAEVLTVRNYHGVKRMFAAPENIAAVLGAVTAQAGVGLAELESATSLRGPNIERVLIWLLKYDFVRRCQTA
jgi:hypothetical protein